MSVRFAIIFLIVLSARMVTYAQFSAYSSLSYGYHQNPLYNYARAGDQMKQAYFEFGYLKELEQSRFNLQYVSGLVLFNQLSDRNFYEHSLIARYSKHHPRVNPIVQAQPSSETNSEQKLTQVTREPADSTDESETDSTSVATDSTAMSDTTSAAEDQHEDEEETAVVDSSGSFFGFSAKATARHDRETFQEFDNQGVEMAGFYRWMTGETTFLHLTDGFSIRNYPNLTSLSNLNDVFTAELGFSSAPNYAYGVMANLGFKYYTESQYDTTRFQSNGQSFNVNPPGKGKGGGNLSSGQSKRVLIQPKTNGTLQFALGGFLRVNAKETAISVTALYRRIPISSARYLAQTSGGSTLTEDIYTDHFSYEGFELHARFEQSLFWKIKGIAEAGFQSKLFEAPAFDLSAVEIASRRKDLRSEVEFYLSRFFELSGDLGIDVSLSAAFVRNQSNDDYNDFSFNSVSFGIGIGF